jgi:8-oxo-dGTP pyrophosphatase MutT (NUDIX family)
VTERPVPLIDVIDHPNPLRPAEPAATVVLLRDGPSDELEVLMIHRGVDTAFGGMWAFPGGVIEAGDVPDGTAPDPLPAARRAAAREAGEEVGLDVDESALVYWSHWLPPNEPRRRFSTWFFVTAADKSHADEFVSVADVEILDHRWLAPANALAMQASGTALVAPPTYVTLEQLARYGDVASVLESAVPRHFATEIAFATDGTRICLWQGDAGYGLADPMVQGPRRRLVMDESAGWRYLDHD